MDRHAPASRHPHQAAAEEEGLQVPEQGPATAPEHARETSEGNRHGTLPQEGQVALLGRLQPLAIVAQAPESGIHGGTIENGASVVRALVQDAVQQA